MCIYIFFVACIFCVSLTHSLILCSRFAEEMAFFLSLSIKAQQNPCVPGNKFNKFYSSLYYTWIAWYTSMQQIREAIDEWSDLLLLCLFVYLVHAFVASLPVHVRFCLSFPLYSCMHANIYIYRYFPIDLCVCMIFNNMYCFTLDQVMEKKAYRNNNKIQNEWKKNIRILDKYILKFILGDIICMKIKKKENGIRKKNTI